MPKTGTTTPTRISTIALPTSSVFPGKIRESSPSTKLTARASHTPWFHNLAPIFSLIEGWLAQLCTGIMTGRDRRATCKGFSRGSRLSLGGWWRRSWRSSPSTQPVRKILHASAMAGRTQIHLQIPADLASP